LDPAASAPTAVAVTVQRTVRPGREGDYEQWLRDVTAVAGRFPGHLGAEVVRPPPGGRAYILLFRFDTLEHLLGWEASDERRRWVAEADALSEGPAAVVRVTGLETWFALPGQGPVTPPPRWKMVLVSWVATFLITSATSASWRCSGAAGWDHSEAQLDNSALHWAARHVAQALSMALLAQRPSHSGRQPGPSGGGWPGHPMQIRSTSNALAAGCPQGSLPVASAIAQVPMQPPTGGGAGDPPSGHLVVLPVQVRMPVPQPS
jgi:antibiotic biosynthesis monooxygenase (ABM) superfamily enzyme